MAVKTNSQSRPPVDPSCPAQASSAEREKWDLLRFSPVKRLLGWRGLQFSLQLPNVLVYLLVIFAGFYGTQTSTQNFATVVTWLIWWSAIVFTFVFVGRLWCLMCPFAALAEWLQRAALWWVRKDSFGLERKWPQKLRNLYPATLFFLVLTWVDHQFGLVSSPLATAYFVFIILAVAVLVGLIFERRTFCRYLCPIGGLIATYSLFASAELRAASAEVCKGHKEKNCLVGRGKTGYGCPVREYPGSMDNNAFCTLCTECVKTCPKDNIAFKLRPFASDLLNLNEKRIGLDMAILAVVLLALPTFQTLVMVEPWEGWMSAVQTMTGLPAVGTFTGAFLVGTLLIPLGLFVAAAALAKTLLAGNGLTLRRLFTSFAFAFVPVGLMMHLAHNVKHLFGEAQIVIPVLSDPFGWGWNLFGTAGTSPLSPFGVDLLTRAQFLLILIGQAFAVYVAYAIARRLFGPRSEGFVRALVPVLVLSVFWSILNLWVLSMPLMERH